MMFLSDSTDKPARRPGRPIIHDWEGFWIEAVRLADMDGLPDSQADFVRHMLDWFERTRGAAPVDSQVKEKASKLYRTLADN